MFYILLFVFRIITISFSNSILPESLHENLGSCSNTCNHLWDGFGQWKNNQWKPYLQGQYATYCIFHIQFRGEKYSRFQYVEFSNGSSLFRSHRFTWTPTSISRTRYCGQLSKSDKLNSWFVLSRLSRSEAVYIYIHFRLTFLFAPDPRLVFSGSKVFQIMLFLRALNPFPWISETCDEGVSLLSIRAYNYTNAVLFCRCMTFKH